MLKVIDSIYPLSGRTPGWAKLKMVKVAGKEDAQSLAYFELSQDEATKLMEAS